MEFEYGAKGVNDDEGSEKSNGEVDDQGMDVQPQQFDSWKEWPTACHGRNQGLEQFVDEPEQARFAIVAPMDTGKRTQEIQGKYNLDLLETNLQNFVEDLMLFYCI